MIFSNLISLLEANESSVYVYSMLYCAAGLSLLSLCFLFQRTPSRESKQYSLASKLVGIVSMLYAGLCVFMVLDDTRALDSDLAASVSTSMYYLSGLIFEVAILPLIRPGFNVRKATIRNSLVYVAFLLFVISGHTFFSQYGIWIAYLGSIWFGVDAMRISISVFATYFKMLREVEQVSSADILPRVQWIFRAAFAMILWGLMGSIMLNLGRIPISLFSDLGVLVYLYIYLSMNGYMLDVDKTEPVLKEAEQLSDDLEEHGDSYLKVTKWIRQERAQDDGEELVLLPEQSQQLLEQWIAEKGYLEENLSVSVLAEKIGTNRYYLSRYINQHYERPFRAFVNRLRVQEACAYKQQNPAAQLSEVSEHCGYSTSAYFSTIFKQEKGISYSQYAEIVEKGA